MASYFNADYYFAAKAKQLSTAEKPWTAAEVQAEFAKQGINAEDHFKTYGASEGLSPNPYFNEKEYLETKLKSLQENAATKAEWTGKSAADLKAAFSATGLTAAEHYEKAGAFETRADGTLLNPSNAFDANAYFAAKLAQLQKAGFDGADTMTVADVVKAVQAAGISPVSHLQAAGAAEAKADGIPLVQTVPSEQRVANDPARVATGEIVPSNYNPPSKAPAAAVAAPVTKPADVGGLSAAKPVVPTAPVKVPGDAGYIAPPPTLKDTNEKPVLPPTTTEGTGPNAGFLVVDPKTGTAEVVNPETGEVQGEVKVEVKPDGSITPPAPNAPVVDKDGNNTNDKPVDDTGKPVEPDTPSDGGDGDGDGGGDGGNTNPPSSTFTVTEGTGADAGKWTVGKANGDVTITESGLYYVFTPTTGTAVEVLKAAISNSVIVDSTIKLSGKAAVLDALTAVTGAVTVTDSEPVTAAALTAIKSAVSGDVNVAASVTAITGAEADITTVFSNASIKGLGAKNITITDNPTVAEANALDAKTTGEITATFAAGTAANLKVLTAGNNAYTISLTAATTVAVDLKAIAAATSLPVDADKITEVTGSAAEILEAYGIAKLVGLGDAAITVSGVAKADQAAKLLAASTGVVTLVLDSDHASGGELTVQIGDKITIGTGTTTTFESSASANAEAVTGAGKWFLDPTDKLFTWAESGGSGSYVVKSITLKNCGNVTIPNDTTGVVTIAAGTTFSVAAKSGATDTYAISTENGNVTVTESSDNLVFTPASGTAANVTKANLLGNTLEVSDLITLSGTAANLKLLPDVTGSVTVTASGTVAAADLTAIAAKVSGKVNVGTGVTGITGTNAEIQAVLTEEDIQGYGALTVTASDSITVADANKLDAKTTGVVTATISEQTIAKLATLTGGAENAYTITVADTTATADALLRLDALTSVSVTASAVTSISGSAAKMKALSDAGGSTITLKNDVALTINDVAGTAVAATDLSAIGGETTGAVTVTNGIKVYGTNTQILAALDTDATKVILSADSIVQVSDTVKADAGSKLALLNKVKADFTAGVTDTHANLATGATISQNLKDILADDATVDIIATDATITAETLNALDAANGVVGKVSTNNGGGWTITALTGKTVAATSSVDKFVFAGKTDVNVTINDFKDAGADKLDVNALTSEGSNFTATHVKTTNKATAVTIAEDKIYFITAGTAGDADSKAAAVAFINESGTWSNASTSAHKAVFVLVDNDSTALYLYTEDTTKGTGVTADELTLIGTVDSVTVAGDYAFS